MSHGEILILLATAGFFAASAIQDAGRRMLRAARPRGWHVEGAAFGIAFAATALLTVTYLWPLAAPVAALTAWKARDWCRRRPPRGPRRASRATGEKGRAARAALARVMRDLARRGPVLRPVPGGAL